MVRAGATTGDSRTELSYASFLRIYPWKIVWRPKFKPSVHVTLLAGLIYGNVPSLNSLSSIIMFNERRVHNMLSHKSHLLSYKITQSHLEHECRHENGEVPQCKNGYSIANTDVLGMSRIKFILARVLVCFNKRPHCTHRH